MKTKKSVKATVTYSLNVKFGGEWRQSPEYATAEEACKNLVPFVNKHGGQYLSVTIIRNVRYVAAE